ncbi:MAG: energy-coupling factor transporter ATPase [Synergistetes bacterium]|nr:energy-coupling factor transporter ATPase [Synergistota bacterium]
MIKLLNVKFSYGDKVVFDGINLEIQDGEWIALVGANGSGKSTLAKLLNGILIPTDGDVIVDGLNTRDESSLWEIRKRVGVVFQNPDTQIVASVVEEDIAFGPENLGVPPDEIRKRVDEALEMLRLTRFRSSPTYALSGGQKQKLAIAGILAMKPRYLVVDEPTSMLDPPSREEINSILLDLHNKENLTIVYSTHNPDEVLLANRVILLKDGRIIFDGKPFDFFSDPELPWNAGVKIPVMTYIAYRIRKRGIKVNFPVFSAERLADELWQLKLRK